MDSTPPKKLTRYARDAAKVHALVESIWADMEKIPSFQGKARFMDKVNKTQKHSHNLAWNLKHYPDDSNN